MGRWAAALSGILALVIGVSGFAVEETAPGELTYICPLGTRETERAMEKFALISPVFHDRRCENCHGAVNPFTEEGGHLGGVMEADADCAECHDPAKAPWRLASSAFHGETDAEHCEHFQQTMLAEEFVRHISDDDLGFIPVAFQGTRGLNDYGKSIFEEASGRTFVREPVGHGSFSTFEANAHGWAEALRMKFRKIGSCGCKPVKYRLIVRHGAVIDETISDAEVDYVVPDPPVVFDLVVSNGLFAAEAAAPREVSGEIETPQGGCVSEAKWTDIWNVNGEFVDDETQVRFRFLPERDGATGTVTCTFDGKTVTVPAQIPFPPSEWTDYFTMPARVGEPARFDYELPGLSAASGGKVEFIFEKVED